MSQNVAWRCFAALLAASVLVACSSSGKPPGDTAPPVTGSTAAASVAVSGTLRLPGIVNGVQGAPCHEVGAGYRDIRPGAQVVISDDSGRTLTIAHLGRGHVGDQSFRCEFPFAAHVPAGKRFYGIEVTHRGVVKEPEGDLGNVVLTLR